MKKFDIKVDGMVCGGCEKRVVNALKEKGYDSKASFKKGLVTIKSKEEIDVNSVKSIISNLGFEVVGE